TGRLARWALKLQEFDIVIGYRPGKSHQNADTLSRIPILPIAKEESKTESQVNNLEKEWTELQHEDNYCRRIIENLKKIQNGNKKGNINGYKLNEKQELIDRYGRIVVPIVKIREIMEENHDHILARHLGITKTLARLQRQYSWPNMRSDDTAYVNCCLKCARRKAFDTSKAPLQPFPPIDRVWERIAMDVV
ncbi:Uncharacterized protein APZ42_009381, partial [Daphnia magna]